MDARKVICYGNGILAGMNLGFAIGGVAAAAPAWQVILHCAVAYGCYRVFFGMKGDLDGH